MIYVFDLDDTLCFPNKEHKDSHWRYDQARPNEPMIKVVQKLAYEGHTIIIHTARRMLTHKGDIGAVVQDIGAITHQWLDRHNVPYHQVVFGKPYGDYYIDDKNVSLKDAYKL